MIILNFIFLIFNLVFFYKIYQIKINKNLQQEEYEQVLKNKIIQLEAEIDILKQSELEKRKEIGQHLIQWQNNRKKELNENLQKEKEIIKLNLQKVNNEASKEIEDIHKDLNNIRQSAIQEKKQIQIEIDKLKASLSAGVEARLREQEKKDKINFYKLSISETDLVDIKILQELKFSLHNPVILSKLIWTQYFQKQITQLCDRVFGKNPISGIYKITDLITKECYIGQSVNIQERIKQHCKCGLGIEASTTNKLYNVMQKDKIWNFTFELLEQCSRQLLNEKEKLWIQMYQSDKFGLNTMKGINK